MCVFLQLLVCDSLDCRWYLELQRGRTVRWTWTVRLEIFSVRKTLIPLAQVEQESWPSRNIALKRAVFSHPYGIIQCQ